jgi:uncharacterized protein (TIGR03086 family)
MSDNQLAYIKGLFCFDAVVQRTEPDRWDNQSPCARWTARRVVDHNLMVCNMIVEMTRGNPAAVHEGSVERPFPAPSGDGLVLAPHMFQRFVSPDDDPVAAWNKGRDDVLAALDQPGALHTESRSPWGHCTVDSFLGFAFFDPLVHAWDLAMAVGQKPVLDAALAQRALDHLAAFGEQHELRQPGVLTEQVAASAQDPVSRLIAFSGRQA